MCDPQGATAVVQHILEATRKVALGFPKLVLSHTFLLPWLRSNPCTQGEWCDLLEDPRCMLHQNSEQVS